MPHANQKHQSSFDITTISGSSLGAEGNGKPASTNQWSGSLLNTTKIYIRIIYMTHDVTINSGVFVVILDG